jgi:hypothetical protein
MQAAGRVTGAGCPDEVLVPAGVVDGGESGHDPAVMVSFPTFLIAGGDRDQSGDESDDGVRAKPQDSGRESDWGHQ